MRKSNSNLVLENKRKTSTFWFKFWLRLTLPKEEAAHPGWESLLRESYMAHLRTGRRERKKRKTERKESLRVKRPCLYHSDGCSTVPGSQQTQRMPKIWGRRGRSQKNLATSPVFVCGLWTTFQWVDPQRKTQHFIPVASASTHDWNRYSPTKIPKGPPFSTAAVIAHVHIHSSQNPGLND